MHFFTCCCCCVSEQVGRLHCRTSSGLQNSTWGLITGWAHTRFEHRHVKHERNWRRDCHRCFQGHFLTSRVSVTPPPTRSPPLWMVRQCMNPDCRVDRVNSRGSKPLSDIDYVFLICFCCRAPMTHTSLLLLFLYSGSSLASPPCRLCTSSSTHTPKTLNLPLSSFGQQIKLVHRQWMYPELVA